MSNMSKYLWSNMICHTHAKHKIPQLDSFDASKKLWSGRDTPVSLFPAQKFPTSFNTGSNESHYCLNRDVSVEVTFIGSLRIFAVSPATSTSTSNLIAFDISAEDKLWKSESKNKLIIAFLLSVFSRRPYIFGPGDWSRDKKFVSKWNFKIYTRLGVRLLGREKQNDFHVACCNWSCCSF